MKKIVAVFIINWLLFAIAFSQPCRPEILRIQPEGKYVLSQNPPGGDSAIFENKVIKDNGKKSAEKSREIYLKPCLENGITFSSQADLDNFLDNYPGCTIIGGDVVIRSSGITNLSNLSNIISIDGSLTIVQNDLLTSLNGLNKLNLVNGDLIIGNDASGGNNALNNLTALHNLKLLGGNLVIKNNPSLESLNGLERITPGTIINLTISNNPQLSVCENTAICDYLQNNTGNVLISNNKTGCNSEAEIKAHCSSGIEDFIFEPLFTLYPNPTEKILSIKSRKGLLLDKLVIYNGLGQILITQNKPVGLLDVSMLVQGIYIVELSSGSLLTRKKLIIR